MPDVYAFGVIAPSTLVVLEDDYPPPAGYAEIAGVHSSIGGEAAAGAYVLARLGVGTSLDGTWLGADESSARALEILTTAGVDCSAISRASEAVTEIVISAGAARTVFGTYRKLAADRAWNDPSEESIRSSRVVCLDPFLAGASEQAARWCRDAGTPYVTVDAPPDSEIARHAGVLVISEEYATRESGTTDPQEVLASYTERSEGLVIATRGSEPLLYGRRDGQPREYPPFPVDVRDTTGAGDSFRAGIIYGMLNGYNDEELVRTGAAVAALVCERFPGVLNSPTGSELSEFLAHQP
jgi:sugar/nucleoside kinase (ribokinase family)